MIGREKTDSWMRSVGRLGGSYCSSQFLLSESCSGMFLASCFFFFPFALFSLLFFSFYSHLSLLFDI